MNDTKSALMYYQESWKIYKHHCSYHNKLRKKTELILNESNNGLHKTHFVTFITLWKVIDFCLPCIFKI